MWPFKEKQKEQVEERSAYWQRTLSLNIPTIEDCVNAMEKQLKDNGYDTTKKANKGVNLPFEIVKVKDLPTVNENDVLDLDTICVYVKQKGSMQPIIKQISKDEMFRRLGKYIFDSM